MRGVLLQLPQNVDGVIGQPRDVDVFRLEAKAGQEVVLEVLAARYGSPLDSILTLYNADGQILASNDDHDGSPDSRIVATLPKTGTYYLAVIDANDQGGPAYGYRLVVQGSRSASPGSSYASSLTPRCLAASERPYDLKDEFGPFAA